MFSTGCFITFEGPDGSGKSTQIRLFKEYLEEKGYDYLLTREPGGTPISERIRDIILDKELAEMDPRTEAFLYASARVQLLAQVIRPAIAAGKIVVSDRFVDSSIAYQAYGRELGDEVVTLNQMATCGFQPDLTFLLMVDPGKARKRLDARPDEELDRLERESLAFHKRVYNGYMKLAAQYPQRIVLLDGCESIEAIAALIREKTEAFLSGR